jgi:hypothetical protein
MNQPWLEQLNQNNTSAVEAAVSLGELATRNATTFARHEVGLLSHALEDGLENMQAVGHATTLQQVFDRQRELTEQFGPRLAALASDQVGLMLEMQAACTAWLQGRFDKMPGR